MFFTRLKIITLASAGLLLLPSSLQAEFHTFTNSSGITLKAELVSHKDGKITLRRADAKEFEVDPTIFSTADQKFIATWMQKTPELVSYNFRIDSDKKKLSGTTSNTDYSRSKTGKWAYVISITNQSQDAVSGLTFSYRLLYKSSSDTYSGRTHSVVTGVEQLKANLEFNRTLEITTKPVTLDSVSYSYSGDRYKDEIIGCLLRVTDKQGEIIIDWTSPELSMKDKTWENTDPKNGVSSGSATIK